VGLGLALLLDLDIFLDLFIELALRAEHLVKHFFDDSDLNELSVRTDHGLQSLGKSSPQFSLIGDGFGFLLLVNPFF